MVPFWFLAQEDLGGRLKLSSLDYVLRTLCTFGTDDAAPAGKVGEMPRQFQPLGLTAGDAALSRGLVFCIKQVKIV